MKQKIAGALFCMLFAVVFGGGATFQWRLEVDATNKPLPMPYGFDIEMRPAPAEAYAPAFKKVAIAVACVFAALIAIPFVIALVTGT